MHTLERTRTAPRVVLALVTPCNNIIPEKSNYMLYSTRTRNSGVMTLFTHVKFFLAIYPATSAPSLRCRRVQGCRCPEHRTTPAAPAPQTHCVCHLVVLYTVEGCCNVCTCNRYMETCCNCCKHVTTLTPAGGSAVTCVNVRLHWIVL